MKRIAYGESLGTLDRKDGYMLLQSLVDVSRHTEKALNATFGHGFEVIAEFESPIPETQSEKDRQMQELLARPSGEGPIELSGRQRPVGTRLVRLILEPKQNATD